MYFYIYSEHQTTEITNGTEENGICKPEDENTTDQELLGIPEFNQANQVGSTLFTIMSYSHGFLKHYAVVVIWFFSFQSNFELKGY